MWELSIENIAGIRAGETTLNKGTNAVQASNWQGKTSFVIALRIVLGVTPPKKSITTGESEGWVKLSTDDDKYEVTLSRTNNDISLSGETYLTDSADLSAAELFAVLDEFNEIRAAVRENEDLTPLLTRPLDHENIDSNIENRKTERERLKSELDDIKKAAVKLPKKLEQRNTLESKVSDLESELGEVESTNDRGDQSALRDQLSEARGQHERVSNSVNRLEREVESLTNRLADKQAELADFDVPKKPDVERELSNKQDRLDQLENAIDTLQTLYNANKQVLERDHIDLVTDVERSLSGDSLDCWVCGKKTERSIVESRLSALAEEISHQESTVADLRTEIKELTERLDRFERSKRKKTNLESEISSLSTRLTEREDTLESTRERLEAVTETVEEIEAKIEEADERRSELESDIARSKAQLETIEQECTELERKAEKKETLQTQIETISAEIESLRRRREQLIKNTQTTFEEALNDIVAELGPSFEAAQLRKHTDPTTGKINRLELIIARQGREITVSELSEGEVELVGVIAALAGYEAFDVAETVPCLLLDDVGGLASENLRSLAEYLADRTTYLVTTAYPEIGEFSAHTVSPSDWSVVSDHSPQLPDR